MEIKFNANAFAIPSNEQGQYHATSLSQAWAEAGGQKNALKDWKESLSEIYIAKFALCTSKARNDRGGGTWVNKRGLLAFAAYCSEEFEDAVYEAFIALTEGKPYEAAAIAESVAVSDELIALHDSKRLAMNVAITASGITMKGQEYGKFYDLALKASTGYTAAQLTGKNGTAKDYIKEVGSPDCLNAVIASMDLIISGLSVGLGYHEVATMLKVLTYKNKALLAANDTNYKEAA